MYTVNLSVLQYCTFGLKSFYYGGVLLSLWSFRCEPVCKHDTQTWLLSGSVTPRAERPLSVAARTQPSQRVEANPRFTLE